MEDCIFCKIAGGDPKNFVWQNDVAVAVKDLYPKAPVHVLVMPRQHMPNLDHLEDSELAGKLLLAVREVAHAVGLKGRWQMRVNNGRTVGQSIDHLHFHILGGKEMPE